MSCSVRLEGFGFSLEKVEEAVRNRRLLSMEIEFGRKCNFRCPYCYVADPASEAKELTPDEIRGAIDQSYELGARRLIILGGEPMLYPHLQDMVRHIASKGMEIELFTNGTNVTPEMADFFFGHGVKVVFKLNTFDPTVQIQLTGREWAYDCIHSALNNLLAAGYPTPEKRIAASTIICRQNIGELKDLWCWLRDRDIDPYFEMITPQGRGSRNQWLYPDAAETEALFLEIARIDNEKYGRIWEPQPPLVGNKCLRNQFSCLVDAYGNVMPCVGITIPAGNLRERPLQEILSGSLMFEDLRNFKGRIKGPCSECGQAGECYGCRGAAYQLTGDYLASDPLCWHNKHRLEEIVRLPAAAAPFAPQEIPMLLVDQLISVGDGEAVAETTVRADMLFVDRTGHLDNAAYLEMMAQTVAVYHGFQHSGQTHDAPCGMLLGTRDLDVRGEARTGDVLRIRIRHTTSFGAYSVLSGTITRGGETLAAGELKVWEKTPELQPSDHPRAKVAETAKEVAREVR
ncbi:MAG: radical SAM protein [Verrucomicrobiae bacterium]